MNDSFYWDTDVIWTDYLWILWGLEYLCTMIVSVLGIPFIACIRALVNLILMSDMAYKVLYILSPPEGYEKIWSMNNWFFYAWRRWFIDLLTSPLHFFTQIIPLFNWLLNCFPIGLQIINLLV